MRRARETYQSTDDYDPVLRCHTRVGPPKAEAMDYGRVEVKVGRRVMTYEEYRRTYLGAEGPETEGRRPDTEGGSRLGAP